MHSREKFLALIMTLLATLITLFGIISSLTGIVGGIWLAIGGYWRILFAGLLADFTSHYLLGIAMIPNLPLGALAVRLFEQGGKGQKSIAFVLTFISNVYLIGLFSFWGVFVFSYFLRNWPDAPLGANLLWAYSTAIAPIAFMARHERDAPLTLWILVSTALSYFLLVALVMFGSPGERILKVYLIAALVNVVFICGYQVILLKPQGNPNQSDQKETIDRAA